MSARLPENFQLLGDPQEMIPGWEYDVAQALLVAERAEVARLKRMIAVIVAAAGGRVNIPKHMLVDGDFFLEQFNEDYAMRMVLISKAKLRRSSKEDAS